MNLDEAVALLKEIHELQPWLSQDADLAARVESALAAHEAEERVEVEWMPNGPKGFWAYRKGCAEKASVYQSKDGLWWASASDIGPFETLDEAKAAAAVAAARGQK